MRRVPELPEDEILACGKCLKQVTIQYLQYISISNVIYLQTIIFSAWPGHIVTHRMTPVVLVNSN